MHITTIERYILESISRGNTTLKTIQQDTSLSFTLTSRVVQKLLQEELIVLANYHYQLANLSNIQNITYELDDLCLSMNRLYIQNKSQLNLRKFYCSEKDEKILQAILSNLDSFTTGLSSSKKPLAEHKVLYLATASYLDIINQEKQLRLV